MNVALLIENLVGGGSERVVARLADGLARRGHRVFVYCLREAGCDIEPLRAVGVTVRAAHSVGRDPLLAWRLGTWLRRDRIHVAHAHSCTALIWVYPAARVLGIPIVHVRHGMLLGQPTRHHWLARGLDYLVDRLVVCSHADRATLPAALAQRAVHVPNGVDLERIAAEDARRRLNAACGRALDGPIVLSVGTICPEKDTRGLLEAFASVQRRQPRATLVCVGAERGSNYAARVRQTCARLRLDEQVIFAGPVNDAWKLMAAADVFCLSSVTEAMPNVILEAMSQGVPIVATAVGDVGRLESPPDGVHRLLRHQETALLVPPGNPTALADALCRALDEPQAAQSRAVRATEDYQRFYTAAPMLDRYEQLYRSCRQHGERESPLPVGNVEHARPRVLMLGPPPQQIGGMTSVIDSLLASPLRERYELQRYWHTLDGPGLPGRFGAVLRHLRTLRDFVRVLWRRKIDVVHIHTCSYFSYYRSLLDVAIARVLRRRVFLHIHGARFDRFCADSGPWARHVIRSGSRLADAVIVLSRDWQRRLHPYLAPARLVVVPNGVAAQPLRQNAADHDHACRFLFLGELTRRKGVAELIDAAAQLQTRGVPFELTFAGPPAANEPDDWPQRVAELGLADHVRFVGPVSGDAKERLLADSDCLVLPSHHEGLPMAILEAAAAGMALVSTTVGGIPEFAQPDAELPALPNTAFIAPLVPPGDVPALTEALESVARDADLRRRIAANVHARLVAGYSIEHSARRIAELYAERARPRSTTGLDEYLARYVTFPLHERLRGRRTLSEVRQLADLADQTPTDVERLATHRLSALLQFAARELPYYRDLFTQHGVSATSPNPAAELLKLPRLDKPTVRANAAGMTWQNVPGGLQPLSTGGTTGDTLHFHIDRVRQAQDQGARLFMQGLFGVPPGARRLYLWGSPIECRRTRFKRWRDRLINEVLLNAFEMSPAQMDAHLTRIRKFQPRAIYGYPTAVALLAQHAGRRYGPRHFPWLQLIVLTGEEVTPDQRAQAQAVFGCPVVAEYGNREVGLIAHECPAGALHVLTPHLHVEVLAKDAPAAPGQLGEIVCTTLNTRAQPFIRYRLGDVGLFLDQPCPCGLPLPILQLAGGKVTGFIALPDGRLCHGAVSTHMLREEVGIVEFKTYQRRLDWIEVLLVVDNRFDARSIDRIRGRYGELFGDQLRVDCRIVDRIPPDPSGKRRHVVSDVAPDYFRFEVVAPSQLTNARD